MPTEYELSEGEKIAATFYIVASILIIEAAIKTQKNEINKMRGIKSTNTGGIPSSRLVVMAEVSFFVGIIIFLWISEVRLSQVIKQAQTNKKVSVKPNQYLTLGLVFFAIGAILSITGAQLKDQESNATIV